MKKSPSPNIAFRRHDHRQCRRRMDLSIEALCRTRRLRLTPRRRQVLDILLASHQPLGAYHILDQLNQADPGAPIAPPIVYRALDYLLAEGLVHRIESRNAFICCSRPGHQCAAQFLICRHCERVAELEHTDRHLLAGADRLGFEVDHAIVEITGICATCRGHG